MKKTVIRRFAVLVVPALLLATGLVHAQNAPIKFLVPYPACGAADQITRLVATEVSNVLGTPIIIENKAGAAGMIAGDLAARSHPDGTTFFVGSNAPLVINQALYDKMPYDPEKDFVPVSGMGKSPLLLVTKPGLGPTELKAFITFAKKRPHPLSMGSASSGNITHLAGEYAANLMGFKMMHVPFAGSAPAIANLMGGQIEIMFDALPSSMQHARAGKIVPLAILDNERFPALANVPTLKEAGFPGAEASAWFGVMAPAKTPPEAVNTLNRAINEALKKPELVERLRGIGAQPMPGSPQEFGKFIDAERAKWNPLVKKLGVKAG